MKFFKKKGVALLVAGGVVLASSLGAYACDRTMGCEATAKTVECTLAMWPEAGGTHTVMEEGKVKICTITYGKAMHKVNCTGCGYSYPDETRTCKTLHSYEGCIDTFGQCKY
ncbi:hypothetical protein D7X48_10500 [bacterium D16-50]|nr:hypothetical protein D7X48_10500 [bacterium D16-50]